MLRETKSFEIDGLDKPITVYELTVDDLINLLGGLAAKDDADAAGPKVGDLRSLLMDKLLPRVTDLPRADMMRLGPSRILQLWENIREVNAAFFDLAKGVGLGDVVEQLRAQFIASYSSLLANSSKLDTPTSGATDTATS